LPHKPHLVPQQRKPYVPRYQFTLGQLRAAMSST
jgi:hypothetical protein